MKKFRISIYFYSTDKMFTYLDETVLDIQEFAVKSANDDRLNIKGVFTAVDIDEAWMLANSYYNNRAIKLAQTVTTFKSRIEV